jgi:hypothetical protein
MAATPGVLQEFQGLHTLHVPAAPHARSTYLGPANRRSVHHALGANLCCHRERAELPLTGMFSS